MSAPALRARDIIAAVAAESGCTVEDLLSYRMGPAMRPRQLAMWIAHALTRQSLPQLGRVFDRHHTTVAHGVRKTEARLDESPAFRGLAARVLDRIEREHIAPALAARRAA